MPIVDGGFPNNDSANLIVPTTLMTIGQLNAVNDDIVQKKAGAWANRTPAQLKTDLVLVKADVGLGNIDNTSDANKPISTAEQTALNLKANLASPTLTTPVLGVATGTSLVVTGTITSSGGGIGYAVGNGGTVTQITSKSTTVILNKLSGTITMINSALAAATIVTFTVTNSQMGATDVVIAQHDSVGTTGAYTIIPNTSAAGSFKISVRNNTAGSLSEAIVIRFAIIKAVTS